MCIIYQHLSLSLSALHALTAWTYFTHSQTPEIHWNQQPRSAPADSNPKGHHMHSWRVGIVTPNGNPTLAFPSYVPKESWQPSSWLTFHPIQGRKDVNQLVYLEVVHCASYHDENFGKNSCDNLTSLLGKTSYLLLVSKFHQHLR